MNIDFDVVIVGFGAGGLFTAYQLCKNNKDIKILVIEKGNALEDRSCPIDSGKSNVCVNCKNCAKTSGAGGSGAFSDGKYNITNNFGGNLSDYVGDDEAIDLMKYVDSINLQMGGNGTVLYNTANSQLKREALKYDLHLLDANVRHLGTDKNYYIIKNIIDSIKDRVTIVYNTEVTEVNHGDSNLWSVEFRNDCEDSKICCKYVIIATGRSGSKWTSYLCNKFGIENKNDRVDIGVRFECPSDIWESITDEVYESKIVYRSPKTGCNCRTFCMNPHGKVVAENTNGIVTVNGHSYSDKKYFTDNTNFALLVTHRFTEPFKDSNAYGEHVARLVNMLSGGVMVQRFGDLLDSRRTNMERLNKSFTTPTLKAVPGNLGLCLPKQTLDTIIEMIFALDKFVPGTANYDNLLYGAEVKFYNSVVSVGNNFESKEKGLYFIGDCSGTTHSLSQASSEGIVVANDIIDRRLNNND